jgi:hypothetical protein
MTTGFLGDIWHKSKVEFTLQRNFILLVVASPLSPRFMSSLLSRFLAIKSLFAMTIAETPTG